VKLGVEGFADIFPLELYTLENKGSLLEKQRFHEESLISMEYFHSTKHIYSGKWFFKEKLF